MTAPIVLDVATLNVRNTDDRPDRRLQLILAGMERLQPHLMGLQEVIFPLQQDRLIAAAGPARYRVLQGWAGEVELGNSLLVREPIDSGEPRRLDLGHDRSAVGSVVTLAGGIRVAAASTQLHHVESESVIRDEQSAALMAWLDTFDAPVRVLLSVLNDRPGDPAYARLAAAGYRSAHLEATGREPALTWPTGPAPGRTGGRARRQGYWLGQPEPGTEEPGCFDYIWVRGPIRVESCRVAFDRPADDDPSLYPSDHLGLAARLVVGPA